MLVTANEQTLSSTPLTPCLLRHFTQHKQPKCLPSFSHAAAHCRFRICVSLNKRQIHFLKHTAQEQKQVDTKQSKQHQERENWSPVLTAVQLICRHPVECLWTLCGPKHFLWIELCIHHFMFCPYQKYRLNSFTSGLSCHFIYVTYEPLGHQTTYWASVWVQ